MKRVFKFGMLAIRKSLANKVYGINHRKLSQTFTLHLLNALQHIRLRCVYLELRV